MVAVPAATPLTDAVLLPVEVRVTKLAPEVTEKVTFWLGLFVPATAAVTVEVAPMATEAGFADRVTPVTVELPGAVVLLQAIMPTERVAARTARAERRSVLDCSIGYRTFLGEGEGPMNGDRVDRPYCGLITATET
jgi:hypothetical protein